MSNLKPTALELDLHEMEMSEVYAPPLPIDGEGEFEDHEPDDLLHELTEEFCLFSPSQTHTYLGTNSYCCHCGMGHPGIRR